MYYTICFILKSLLGSLAIIVIEDGDIYFSSMFAGLAFLITILQYCMKILA
jgi:hypothetical protein